MEHEVRIITGPPSDRIKKEEAVAKLTSHPQFPKNASFNIENVEGRWIAAVAIPTQIEKVSAPPFEGPPSDGPADAGPPSDDAGLPPELDGPEGDDAPGDDAPKEDDKGDKGLEGKVEHLTEMLTKIVDALGLGDSADSPVPGADAPHAPEGSGAPGEHADAEGKTHTVHERAMKPGESPPGSTPIGSPAFASVADDHPWKGILGQKKTFTVEEEIGDRPLSDVHAELQTLANGTGYKVQQLREASADGRRTAKALLQAVA